MVKIKTGHYYLADDGKVVYIAQDFVKEQYAYANIIGKERMKVNKDFLLKYLKQDLGPDRKVVHILYSNKIKEHT